jgi:hypothetical protein
MSEQEFQGWMLIGIIVLPALLFAWWMGERGDRKAREKWRDEHSPFVILMADSWNVSREEAYALICDVERRLGIRQK